MVKAVRFGSPGEAIERGVAMIPDSRKEQGLILGRPVRENVSLPHLRRFSRAGVVGRGPERAAVLEMMERVGYRGSTMEKRAFERSKLRVRL